MTWVYSTTWLSHWQRKEIERGRGTPGYKRFYIIIILVRSIIEMYRGFTSSLSFWVFWEWNLDFDLYQFQSPFPCGVPLCPTFGPKKVVCRFNVYVSFVRTSLNFDDEVTYVLIILLLCQNKDYASFNHQY